LSDAPETTPGRAGAKRVSCPVRVVSRRRRPRQIRLPGRRTPATPDFPPLDRAFPPPPWGSRSRPHEFQAVQVNRGCPSCPPQCSCRSPVGFGERLDAIVGVLERDQHAFAGLFMGAITAGTQACNCWSVRRRRTGPACPIVISQLPGAVLTGFSHPGLVTLGGARPGVGSPRVRLSYADS